MKNIKLKHFYSTRKLICDHVDKEKNLLLYNFSKHISQGIQVTKVHRLVRFKQKPWLNPRVFPTKKSASNTELSNELYSLLVNACYVKTMETLCNRIHIKPAKSDETQISYKYQSQSRLTRYIS